MYRWRARLSNGTVIGSERHTPHVIWPDGRRWSGSPAGTYVGDIDVAVMVADVCERLCGDARLGSLLGLPLDPAQAEPACARQLAALASALCRMVNAALARRPQRDTISLVSHLRARVVEPEDYDRFGHHVLAGALAHRIGPDGLLLIGTVLSGVRSATLPGPP